MTPSKPTYAGEPIILSTKRPRDLKPRWTIRRLMIAIAAVAILFGVVRPIYLAFDAAFHGP